MHRHISEMPFSCPWNGPPAGHVKMDTWIRHCSFRVVYHPFSCLPLCKWLSVKLVIVHSRTSIASFPCWFRNLIFSFWIFLYHNEFSNSLAFFLLNKMSLSNFFETYYHMNIYILLSYLILIILCDFDHIF